MIMLPDWVLGGYLPFEVVRCFRKINFVPLDELKQRILLVKVSVSDGNRVFPVMMRLDKKYVGQLPIYTNLREWLKYRFHIIKQSSHTFDEICNLLCSQEEPIEIGMYDFASFACTILKEVWRAQASVVSFSNGKLILCLTEIASRWHIVWRPDLVEGQHYTEINFDSEQLAIAYVKDQLNVELDYEKGELRWIQEKIR